MPKLIFFSALDATRAIRGDVLLAPGKHAHTLKTVQSLAKRLGSDGGVSVCGEANAQDYTPWLALTEVDFSNLDEDTLANLKTEMARLLAYSSSLRTGPACLLPQLVIEENMRYWERWFVHLPPAGAALKPISDPLEIQLKGRVFLWGLAAILASLALLAVVAEGSGSSLAEFLRYVLQLTCAALLLIGALIIPVFGGLSEQARTLAIAQSVLFLCFQALSGNLWSANGIANTLIKTAILFVLSVGIAKLARLSHDSLLQSVVVNSICSALGVGTVVWLLFFPVF